MKTVVGILKLRSEVEHAVEGLHAIGISNDRINILTPDTPKRKVAAVPTTETEQPGSGSALGGVVGGALGAAGGLSIGAAVASLFVPGIGTVVAIGIASAAILGALGAVGGAASGEALEDSMARGLPIDELFVYEDALRQGRTTVIAFVDDEAQAERARQILLGAGAESVDAARENWWVGLRDDERAVYSQHHDDFDEKEPSYRHGFESALQPAARGKSYVEAEEYLKTIYPKEYASDSFRLGYQRGYAYYLRLLATGSPSF
jgi:hypothetical protein